MYRHRKRKRVGSHASPVTSVVKMAQRLGISKEISGYCLSVPSMKPCAWTGPQEKRLVSTVMDWNCLQPNAEAMSSAKQDRGQR